MVSKRFLLYDENLAKGTCSRQHAGLAKSPGGDGDARSEKEAEQR